MPIQETAFGPKRYLALKKSIPFSQVANQDMYEEAGQKLGSYIQANDFLVTGPWSVLYFKWDMATQQADLAIAFPVIGLEKVEDPELSIVDVPESKAATDVLHGPYDGLGPIHRSLMQYISEKGYGTPKDSVMAIEEYEIDPVSDADPEHWRTRIYYLHG